MSQMSNNETDIYKFTLDYMVYAWSIVMCN